MRKNGLVQPLVLAAMLACGFAVVWGLLGMWAVEVAEHTVRTEVESLSFLSDGTPLVERWNVSQSKTRRYSDLEDNPIEPPDTADHTWLSIRSLPARLPQRAARGDVSWEQRIRSIQDGRASPILWHFVSDGRPDGMAYFIGYDSESNACIGYLGTAGYHEGPLPPEELIPFGGPTSGPRSRVIASGLSYSTRYRTRGGLARAPHGFLSPWDVSVLGREGKMYHADLQNRTVHVALEDAWLRSATLLEVVSDSRRGTLHQLAVRTDDTLLVMDERGEILRRYPLPEAARERELCVAETSTGEAVMYWKNPLDGDGSTRKIEYHICWMAPDGRSRQARTVLPTNDLILSPVQCGIVLPSPVPLGGFLAFFLQQEGTTTYPERLWRTVREFWPALIIVQLLAFAFAALCYRRQVRYRVGRAERIIWPLFVLLLGLPGWIGYRFGRTWPVLETCPACGGIVPRDRGDCARCAAEFPLPALKGTEVFA